MSRDDRGHSAVVTSKESFDNALLKSPGTNMSVFFADGCNFVPV